MRRLLITTFLAIAPVSSWSAVHSVSDSENLNQAEKSSTAKLASAEQVLEPCASSFSEKASSPRLKESLCDANQTFTSEGYVWYLNTRIDTFADRSGRSVALSGDGLSVAIGAPYEDTGEYSKAGQVRVFTSDNGSWVQQGAPLERVGEYNYFGNSLALARNGLTLAVGADGGALAGAVSVFSFDGSSWVQQGSFSGGAVNGTAGPTVALSSDGLTLAIGAPKSDRARVYTFNGISWVLRGAQIDGVPTSGFGSSVALSSDGLTLAVGAPQSEQAQVYAFNGSAWVQRGGSIEDDGLFGSSVALSGDGFTLAVGATLNADNGFKAGQVSIFSFDGSSWIKQGSSINGLPRSRSGTSVDLANDGLTVTIGAPFTGSGVEQQQPGRAAVFSFDGSSWIEQFSVIGRAGDKLGRSVSLAGDGLTLAIGAPFGETTDIYTAVASGGDFDSDGIPDSSDNCPFVVNGDQADNDADTLGDACDQDDDNDGTPDIDDDFPLDSSETTDTDGDGVGNNTDADDDNDGVLDSEDDFPTDPNASSRCSLNNLRSQEDVDALVTSGCDGVVGGLSIEGSEIFDIDGLVNLRRIAGSLSIIDTEGLRRVDGLVNVTANSPIVLTIENNAALNNLDGLAGIRQTKGQLRILRNPVLTNMDGLAQLENVCQILISENGSLLSVPDLGGITYSNCLTSEKSFVRVQYENSLESIGALNVDGLTSLQLINVRNLTSLGDLSGLRDIEDLRIRVTGLSDLSAFSSVESAGYLEIYGNDQITDLDVLSGLANVGELWLKFNGQLSNVNGLLNLTEMPGDLKIDSNDSLSDLDGLQNLQYLGGLLRVSDNISLDNCRGLAALLGGLDGPSDEFIGGGFSIGGGRGNGSNTTCGSAEQIIASVSGPTKPLITDAVNDESGAVTVSFVGSTTPDSLYPITGYEVACAGPTGGGTEAVSASISDGIPVNRYLMVTGFNANGSLPNVNVDIEVDIDITHARANDLKITLISPEGSEFLLWNQNFTATDNLAGTFPTSLTPVDSLEQVTVEEFNGEWTLRIEDVEVGGIVREGVLNGWGLRLTESLQTQTGSGSPITIDPATAGQVYSCVVAPITRLGRLPKSEPLLTRLASAGGDDDGDGIPNEQDNCPLVANSDQANNDGDSQGDACDDDDDNDGVNDSDDDFPLDDSEITDTDGDGIGNNADTDDDNDGFSDEDEINAGTDPLDASSRPRSNSRSNPGIPTWLLYETSKRSDLSVEISASGDDGYELYLDGQLLIEDFDWKVATRRVVSLERGRHVVAIKGINAADGVDVGAIIVDIAGPDFRVVSNSDWEVSLDAGNTWNKLNGSLPLSMPATEYGAVDSRRWWNRDGTDNTGATLEGANFPLDSPAKWIWSSGFKTDAVVYFRKEFVVE